MIDYGQYTQRNTAITVKMFIEINDEEIAQTEVTLLPDSDGFVNVDDAIEWLGKAERHYIPIDLQARYDEYFENQFNNERNDHGSIKRSGDSETTA